MAERLINAVAFEEELENFSAKEINLIFDNPHDKMIARHTVSEVIYLLEKILTIEAKPVVHAHWDDNKCSNCKEEASSHSWEEPIYDYDWDENLQFLYTEHHTEYELTDFCPHCGAQMDEVVE